MKWLLLLTMACGVPTTELDAQDDLEATCWSACPTAYKVIAEEASPKQGGGACLCFCQPGSYEVSFVFAGMADGAQHFAELCPGH